MVVQEKGNHLKYLIDRYDRYFQVVDAKGNIILAYHLFIIGGLLLNYEDLNEVYTGGLLSFSSIVWLTSIISTVSVSIILVSIFPYLRKGAYSDSESLIFFMSVSEMKLERFGDKVRKMVESDLEDDLIEQAHTLAKGLRKKFQSTNMAAKVTIGHLLIAGLILIQFLL
ncbi:hypothetical protein AWW68_13465 [Roseivirga spongicola]|uniref:Pycsar effector protein domain-containing protein n=1 Tax=Roseivirga spongicola TaxID=333140 RepID=A0A150X4P6_9BACT|nr:Pycsar system effector family protein [Roseivirga spongicola]KYG73691.1 hypothetical protein AWW68_13465 [Roseivirga spongicola]